MKVSKIAFLVLFGCSLLLTSCTHDAFSNLDNDLNAVLGLSKTKYILPDGQDLSAIPQSPANPLTKEKIELGKLLFFEPAFANQAKKYTSMFTYSCSSCHVPEAGFRPARMQGIADGGYGFGVKGENRIKYPTYDDDSIDAQGARPLAVLNTAYVTNSMWNGSFGSGFVNEGTEAVWGQTIKGTELNALNLGSLEGQNIDGLSTHRMLYNETLITQAGYKEMFDAAFPDVPVSERYTRKTASFALSAYLRSILTYKAPFQRWLRGDIDAMADDEKRGAILFFGKLNCNSCHSEPNLGAIRFEALGVKDLYQNGGLKTGPEDRRNLGRGGFTGKSSDLYKFRVPQLYNLGDSGPYFHGGSIKTLEGVVRYFNNGVQENDNVPKSQIASYLHPLNMTEQEIHDLTKFLENGLRDPDLLRYKPAKVLSGMCFPNNDPLSKSDMHCD